MEAEQGNADTVPDPPNAGVAPLPQPRPRAHRWGLGAFVVVELVYLGLSASLALAVSRNGPPPASLLALAVAVPTVSAAGLALLIAKIRGNGPRADFRLRWSWRALGLGLVFGIGGLFVTLPAAVLYQSIVGPDVNSAVGEVFSGVDATWPVAVQVFAIVVFIAPFCEEIVYRGLLWGALEQRWGRWIALTVSTVVFALAHFEPTRAPLLLIVALPIALARLVSDSLVASTVAHQVTNLLPGVVILLGLMGMMPAS